MTEAVTEASHGGERRAELAGSLAAVRERIAAAARTAGRDPAEVGLLAVTKTWPAEDVVEFSRLLRRFNEGAEERRGHPWPRPQTGPGAEDPRL